jgi:hypothetical protein
MFRMTSALLAACIASGCVATDAVYPVDWAARVKLASKECPDIDGEYSNQGDMSLQNDLKFDGTDSGYAVEASSISLADILAAQAEGQEQLNFTRVDATTDDHQSVKLHVDGNTLHVLAKRTDGGSRSLELPIRDRCEGSLVDAGASWDGTTTILASNIGRSSMRLGRAEDGALLIRTKQSSGYFFLYVPMFGTTDERWVRFPELKAESASPATAELRANVSPETEQ